MLKAVQFNGQLGCGTIEVQKVCAKRMLASEFEPREAACSQGLPELRLFTCLLAPQPRGVAGRIHEVERRRLLRKDKPWVSARATYRGKWIKRPPLPSPTAVELSQKGSAAWLLPLPAERGEGWGEESVLTRGVRRQENSLGPPLPSPLLPWGRRGRSRRLLRGNFLNSTAVFPDPLPALRWRGEGETPVAVRSCARSRLNMRKGLVGRWIDWQIQADDTTQS